MYSIYPFVESILQNEVPIKCSERPNAWPLFHFFYNLMIHVMRKFVTPIIFFHSLVSIVARAFRRKKFEIFKEFLLNAKIWLIRFIRSRSYRFESITFILSVNMIKTTKRALIVYWASSGFFSSIFHWKLWQQSSKMT